ncbi:MAG: twitching motility protein PilT [Deltaproteobacteria bacterium]|nr:twitching motility protein PilT [Deltaproteobacteria bacterium]
MKINVSIRFYEELNDYLPLEKQKREFSASIEEALPVRLLIESCGVPSAEVDLILVNGKPVPYSYELKKNDRISVYPVFETFDIAGVSKLREKPLREPRFIVVAHLKKLGDYLTMLGLDTKYQAGSTTKELLNLARAEKRIILTGDKNLLKLRETVRGYWIRNTEPVKQLEEVLEYFDLGSQLLGKESNR